jgi:hypothetical protein
VATLDTTTTSDINDHVQHLVQHHVMTSCINVKCETSWTTPPQAPPSGQHPLLCTTSILEAVTRLYFQASCSIINSTGWVFCASLCLLLIILRNTWQKQSCTPFTHTHHSCNHGPQRPPPPHHSAPSQCPASARAPPPRVPSPGIALPVLAHPSPHPTSPSSQHPTCARHTPTSAPAFPHPPRPLPHNALPLLAHPSLHPP